MPAPGATQAGRSGAAPGHGNVPPGQGGVPPGQQNRGAPAPVEHGREQNQGQSPPYRNPSLPADSTERRSAPPPAAHPAPQKSDKKEDKKKKEKEKDEEKHKQ